MTVRVNIKINVIDIINLKETESQSFFFKKKNPLFWLNLGNLTMVQR